MKISINKETITLMKLPEAKELIAEWKDTLSDTRILENFAGIACNRNVKLIKTDYIEVTLNHYEVTLWAQCLVKSSENEFVIVSFDVLKANENIAEAFIQVFPFGNSYTI